MSAKGHRILPGSMGAFGWLVLLLVSAVAASRDPYAERKAAFGKRLVRFREQFNTRLTRTYAQRFGDGNGAEAWRTTEPRQRWAPMRCSMLGYDLWNIGEIHDGKRNSVYLVQDKATKRRFVHKLFDEIVEYTAELNMAMLTAGHPYIAQPICIEPEGRRGGIVFEYVEGPSSKVYAAQGNLAPEDVRRMAGQLLEALVYVHYLGYIHADLKPENVMIGLDGNIKVVDFGFALHTSTPKGDRGTASTMAPELVRAVDGAIHEGVDWWAYGSTVAMWHSLQQGGAGKRFVPLYVNKKQKSYTSNDHGMFTFGTCPAGFDQDLRAFLNLFFDGNPERRRFNTVAQIEFLQNTRYLAPYFAAR